MPTLIKMAGVAEIKADGDGNERVFTAKITTSDLDRDGEVMLPQGMDAKDFRKNPVVFWNHDYNMPIGTVVNPGDLKRADNHWTARAKLASTPFAQEVWTLMKEGVVRGVSVGFEPMESRPATKRDMEMFGDGTRRVYSKWKLREFSVTPMPANQNALIVSVGKGLVSRDRVKALFAVDVPDAAKDEPKRKSVYLYCPRPKAAAVDIESIARKVAAEVIAKTAGRPY